MLAICAHLGSNPHTVLLFPTHACKLSKVRGLFPMLCCAYRTLCSLVLAICSQLGSNALLCIRHNLFLICTLCSWCTHVLALGAQPGSNLHTVLMVPTCACNMCTSWFQSAHCVPNAELCSQNPQSISNVLNIPDAQQCAHCAHFAPLCCCTQYCALVVHRVCS